MVGLAGMVPAMGPSHPMEGALLWQSQALIQAAAYTGECHLTAITAARRMAGRTVERTVELTVRLVYRRMRGANT